MTEFRRCGALSGAVLLSAALFAGNAECADRPANRLNAIVPVNWMVTNVAERVADLRKLHDLGFSRYVLITPWRRRYSNQADVNRYAQSGRDIAAAKAALSDLPDVEIGWWLAPSISSAHGFPGQRIIDCEGHDTFAACPLSEEFADALCERIEACIGIGRPSVMFVEDDYTLSNHGGMNAMKGCFCPLHLAEYAKRVGREYTGAEIAAMFRGPTKENAALRRAFAELSRDSLAHLASRVRATIDKVCPEMRVCLCQSGFIDIDGDATEAVARAFAGRTRPMVRVFGAGYFSEAPAKIPGDMAHAFYTAQHLPRDIELVHETDPYPHTRFYNSALYLVSELSAAVMAGLDGSFYYCTQYLDDPLADTGYAKRFMAESRRLGEVRAIRATMRQCGVRMVYDPAEAYMYRETKERMATGMLTVGGYFLGKMGLPMTMAEDASAALLVGTAPNGLSDEQVERILSGGVLMDAEAATLLNKRGFGDLIGCDTVSQPRDMFYDREVIEPASGCKGRGRELNNARYRWKAIIGWSPKGSVTAKLVPRPGAEEWSSLYDIDGRKVAPATVYFENAKGGRVCVMHRSLNTQPHPSIYSERKQELFVNLFDRLSRGTLDVCANETPGTWVVAARNDSELLVMAENLAGEPRDDFALRFSPEWAGASVFRIEQDGSRKLIGEASGRFRLPAGSLPPTTPEFFLVKKESK